MAQVEDLKLVLKVKDAGGTQVIEKLQNSLRGLERAANKASTSGIDEVARSVRKFDVSGKKNIETLRAQVGAMKALRDQAVIGSSQFKRLTADVNKYSAALNKAEGRRAGGGGLGGLAKGAGAIAAGGVFGGAEGAIGGAIGLIGGPQGAAVGAAIGAQVGMLRQQLGGLAEYSAQINKQRLALQLVTKDSAEYERALAFISQTSKDLAIPQDILTRQFTKLSASVLGAGGNIEDAKKAFIGVASGIRGTGGSLQDLESALIATSQVFSKGKVSAEELRQQIGERLPGAFTLFAQSMGKTPQELDKALERGEVSLQDFQKFALKLFAEYGESAKTLADSPMAAGDRLTTALGNMSKAVGDLLAPIGAAFQSTFADIANAITKAAIAFNEFFAITGAPKMKRLVEQIAEQGRIIAETELKIENRVLNPTMSEKAKGITPDTTFLDRELRQAQAKLAKFTAEYNELERASRFTPATSKPTGLPKADPTDPTGSRKRLPASQKLVDLQTLLAERTGKVGAHELATLNYMIARQRILDNNLLPATDKEEKLQAALARFRKTIFNLREKETKELDKQLKKQQELQASFNKELEDRKYSLGLISKDEYNEALINRERERLEKAYPGAEFAGQREEALALFKQEKQPTFLQSAETYVAKLKEGLDELTKPFNQLKGAANAFGEGIGKAFTNVVTGAQSAKQAMASFLKDLGQYFVEYAAKVITQMIVIATIQAAIKALGGPGLGGGEGASDYTGDVATDAFKPGTTSVAGNYFSSAQGNAFDKGLKRYAMGGVVNKPTMFTYSEGGSGRFGLMGEAGPEGILPLKRGSDGRLGVSAYFADANAAMAKGAANRSSEAAFEENSDALAMATSYVRERSQERERQAVLTGAGGSMLIQTQVINNVEYATMDQVAQATATSAKQARAQVFADMRNRPSTRSSIGIR